MLTDISENEMPKHTCTVSTCLINKVQNDFSIQSTNEEIEDIPEGALLIIDETNSNEELTELVNLDVGEVLKCQEDVPRNIGVVNEETYIKHNEIQFIKGSKRALQSGSRGVCESESLREGRKGLRKKCGFVQNTFHLHAEDVITSKDDICQKTRLESNKQMEVHSKSFYTCKICDISFTSKHSINNHLLSHCTVSEQRRSVCGETFKLSYSMMDQTQMQKQFEHMCNICHITFSTASALQSHLNEHCKDSTCINCGHSFKSRYDTIIHFQHINIVKDLICDICKLLFANKTSIMSHMLTHCNMDAKICQLCEELLNSKIACFHHLHTHNLVKKSDCVICLKSYNKHKVDKKFYCQTCKKSFSSKLSIKQHVIMHYPVETFSCHICKLSFNSRKDISRHMSRQHLVKKISKRDLSAKYFKIYICDYCGKQFAKKKSLSNHMVIHK